MAKLTAWQKIALRQRLADIAAGAGWIHDTETDVLGEDGLRHAVGEIFDVDFPYGPDSVGGRHYDLNTLTDKLWEMGVRA
jgi:hypothetical protein